MKMKLKAALWSCFPAAVFAQGRSLTSDHDIASIPGELGHASWTPVREDIDGADVVSNSPQYGFGFVIAMSSSGNTIAITSDGCDHNGVTYDGCVVVLGFNETSQEWETKGDVLHGDDPQMDVGFGVSIAMTKNAETLVIGSESDHDGIELCGGLWIYRWDEKDQQYVKYMGPIYGNTKGGAYGEFVSISSNGSQVAVGALGENRIELWSWNENDLKKYNIISNSEVLGLGGSASISDTGLVILMAAPADNWTSSFVRVIKFTGEDWTQVGSDMNDEGQPPEVATISRDGSVVAIGYPVNLDNTANGCVWTYRFDSKDEEWAPMGQRLEGTHWEDLFGVSVALSGDGRTLVIGASQLYPFNGYASVYSYISANDKWEENSNARFEGFDPYLEFGFAVTISQDGSVVAIGSPDSFHDVVYGLVSVLREEGFATPSQGNPKESL